MKTKLSLLSAIASVVLLGASSAHAANHGAVNGAAATALAQKSACMACHAVERKMVGPAYKAIADKYKGMDVDKLAVSIKAGGGGKWGPIPMPAQANLSEADAKILAAWILAGAPAK